MPLELLTKAECVKLIQQTPLSNKNKNIPTFAIADFAFIDGPDGPVVLTYELQPPMNSGIGKKSFVKLMDMFDQIYYVSNESMGTNHIRGEGLKEFRISDIEEFTVISEGYFLSQGFKTNEKTLLLFDTTHREYDYLTKQTASHIKKFARLKDRDNLFWSSSEGDLDPSETALSSKHIQRLFGLGMSPEFIFIEKKEQYTKEDIAQIAQVLNLDANAKMVIKSNHGTTDSGNTFIAMNELEQFLNSSEFRKKYSKDDVILIEKFVNQKKENDLYRTERYAFSLCGEDAKYLKIYYMLHSDMSSHKLIEWNWYSEDNNEVEDENIKSVFKKALKTIQQIDYHSLMESLLSSENNVQILIALNFISYNYPVMYMNYESVTKDSKIFTNIRLNMSKNLLTIFEKLLQSDHEQIKKRTFTLFEKILLYLGLVDVNRYTVMGTKYWNNVTDSCVLNRINDMLERAYLGTSSKQEQSKSINTNTNFWARQNQNANQDVYSSLENDNQLGTKI